MGVSNTLFTQYLKHETGSLTGAFPLNRSPGLFSNVGTRIPVHEIYDIISIILIFSFHLVDHKFINSIRVSYLMGFSLLLLGLYQSSNHVYSLIKRYRSCTILGEVRVEGKFD